MGKGGKERKGKQSKAKERKGKERKGNVGRGRAGTVDTKNRAGREKRERNGRSENKRRVAGEADRLREIARLVPGAKRVNHEELVREICGPWS